MIGKKPLNRRLLFAQYFFLSGVALSGVSPALSTPTTTNNPIQILKSADELGDLYNWVAAKPLYAEAERRFIVLHDLRHAFYAHIGNLRATMESQSLPKLSAFLAQSVKRPLVTEDPRFQMRCFAIKGDVDAEIDSAPAQADWEEVLKLAKQVKDLKWQARATGEIGFHRFVQGDHVAARANTASALLAARQMGDYAAQIRFLSGIGTGIVLGGGVDEGIKNYLDRALQIASDHPDTGYPYMAVAGKIRGLITKKDLGKAAPLIEQQIKHASVDQRMVKLTQARLFLADTALAQGRREQAIQILNETIAIAKQNQTRLLTEVYLQLGNLNRESGDLRQAAVDAREAVRLAAESRSMYLAPEILLTLAHLNIALHKDKEADANLNRATDIVEGMLAHITEPQTRQALLTTMSYVYSEHFALAAKHNDPPHAYNIIERVRGRMISEALISKTRTNDPDALLSQLQDKVISLKLQLVKAKSQGERQKLIDDLFYLEQSRWIKEGQASNIAVNEPTISLTQLRRSLQPREVVLEYVLDQQQSYCLMLARSEVRLVNLASRDKIDAGTAELLTGIHDPQSQTLQSTEQSMYEMLISPLGDLTRYSQVTVVPDGSLHTLPFDVLTNSKKQYFGFAHTITYAPSAGSEFILRMRSNRPAERRFFGIGGVPYSQASASTNLGSVGANTSRTANQTDDYDISAMRDLPGSAEEVATAAQSFAGPDSKLAVGNNATKTTIEDADLSNYQVIHFAVHAIVSKQQPENAALILRSNPPKADGFLDEREISHMKLNTTLVVLSACDTAVGRLQGEEGISNLTRAFLIAGSSSVVSTLWPVDDTFSLFLMKSFYEHLARGEQEGRALQNSKVDLLAKFGSNTSPRQWAGFILTGDGTPTIRTIQQRPANARLSEITNEQPSNHH